MIPLKWQEEFAKFAETGDSDNVEFLKFLDTDPVGQALVRELIRKELEGIQSMVAPREEEEEVPQLLEGKSKIILELFPDAQQIAYGNRDEDRCAFELPYVLREREQIMRPLPFCPDHRDKVRGLSCRQCLIESLQKSIVIAIDRLDPDMSRREIVALREQLIGRAHELGVPLSQ